MLIILLIKLTKITLYYRTASIDVIGTVLLVTTFRALTSTGATDMALETAKAAVASTTAT